MEEKKNLAHAHFFRDEQLICTDNIWNRDELLIILYRKSVPRTEQLRKKQDDPLVLGEVTEKANIIIDRMWL